MKNKKGQILLITVMLLATVMTIILSISFKSVTETQVTKLEEESQKALSAAESAIDIALKNNSTAILGPGGSPELSSIAGFTGNASIQTATSKTFTTPSIPKDGSYTFYLGTYDVSGKTITPVADLNDLTICFETGSTNPALEITLVKSSGVKKYMVDPNANQPGRIITDPTNDITGSSICTPNNSYGRSTTIPGATIGVDGQFLLVRVLYASTRLFFSRATDLPIQGRTISSQATSSTSTGVSKKVVLFQSYPQIPGEFFTTAF